MRKTSTKDKFWICRRCGYRIYYNQAFRTAGRYCPNCENEVKIPFDFWISDMNQEFYEKPEQSLKLLK